MPLARRLSLDDETRSQAAADRCGSFVVCNATSAHVGAIGSRHADLSSFFTAALSLTFQHVRREFRGLALSAGGVGITAWSTLMGKLGAMEKSEMEAEVKGCCDFPDAEELSCAGHPRWAVSCL